MPPHRPGREVKTKVRGMRLELLLESTLKSVAQAERSIRKFCKEAGCNTRQLDEIGLAVRECVANAVLHGNCGDPQKKVAIAAAVQKDCIIISVKDQGMGFEIKELPDPRDPRNLLRESGRGVFLIHACMDKVSLRRPDSRGMEVTMVKYLDKTALRRATK